MYFKPLLIPLLAQVALTFTVMLVMYIKRISEMQANHIHPQKVRTRSTAHGLLKQSESAADNLSNLFETPVLFYVAILLALILMLQDPILVALAWAWVAARFVHSLIHITYNLVMHRFYVFILSCFLLFAMWVRLGWIIVQS